MTEPKLKPSFVKKIKKIEQQEAIKVDDFEERYQINKVGNNE